ncbi:MAG: hypothetical protein K6D37_04770 [Prevotella sp.]|nr:hypothetical protein [Prevotella sp.]
MEEMVAPFLPFFVFLLYFSPENDKNAQEMNKKNVPEWLKTKKRINFAKKYGSHERRLLNFSYLCTMAENPSQSKHRKRLAFSRVMNLDNSSERNGKVKTFFPL